MQISLFLALLIAIVAVIFALQNTATTTVRFLVWQFQGSLALLLLIALAAGALASFLASLPAIIRGRLTLRNQRKRVTELEASLADHKARLEETQKQLSAMATPPATAPESPSVADQSHRPPSRSIES